MKQWNWKLIREIALGVGLLIGAFAWREAHHAMEKAQIIQAAEEEKRKAAEQNTKHAQADADAAEKHSHELADKEHEKVTLIEKNATKPMSSDEIKMLVARLLPKGAAVESVDTPKGRKLQIDDTPENRNAIQQEKASCDICSVKLQSRDGQLVDAKKQIDDAFKIHSDDQIELASARKERDQWHSAATRGTGFKARAVEWSVRIGIGLGAWKLGQLSQQKAGK